MEDPLYTVADELSAIYSSDIAYSGTTIDRIWLSTPVSFQTAFIDSYTPPKSDSYKQGYLDAASYYKYELKMLLNAIERADIAVGCRPDKFQLAIDRAHKVTDKQLNEIQSEEEIF